MKPLLPVILQNLFFCLDGQSLTIQDRKKIYPTILVPGPPHRPDDCSADEEYAENTPEYDRRAWFQFSNAGNRALQDKHFRQEPDRPQEPFIPAAFFDLDDVFFTHANLLYTFTVLS